MGSGLACTFDAISPRCRTSVVTRERGAGIYTLAEVASTTHIRCRDKDVEGDGARDCKARSTASREKSMQQRAVCRTRGRSCSVALRDGWCGNDDGLVVAHRSHVLGNIY